MKLLRRCLPVVDEVESDADGAVIFKAHNAYLLDADISPQLSLFRIVSYISLPRGSEECQYSNNYCRYLQQRGLSLLEAVSISHALLR